MRLPKFPTDITLEYVLETPACDVSGKPAKGQREWCVSAIECNDGTTLSVQASRSHYCTPRNNDGPWEEVEVGFPTIEPPETWKEYIDGDWETENRTKTVYGYVPVQLVREFIDLHGGVKSKQEETATDNPVG